MGRRTGEGRASADKAKYDDVVTYAEFTSATLIKGRSLDRYLLDKSRSQPYVDQKTYWFWVYEIPYDMHLSGCDACVRRHHSTNLNCSATRMKPTLLTDMDMLYSFKTQLPVSDMFSESVVIDGTVKGVVVTFEDKMVF